MAADFLLGGIVDVPYKGLAGLSNGLGLGSGGDRCNVLALKLVLFRVAIAITTFSAIMMVMKANFARLSVTLSMGILVSVIDPNLVNNASIFFLAGWPMFLTQILLGPLNVLVSAFEALWFLLLRVSLLV